jgi:hypothetical protein
MPYAIIMCKHTMYNNSHNALEWNQSQCFDKLSHTRSYLIAVRTLLMLHCNHNEMMEKNALIVCVNPLQENPDV